MKKPDKKDRQFTDLKSRLTELIIEYREARDLMSDQIQAVIYNDLSWLDSLVEQQLSKYKALENMEEGFKQQLEKIFRDFCPEESHYSLTLLMEKLDEPSRELTQLRNELHKQVDKTQALRDQLMDLLKFATKNNVDTFEEIFRFNDQDSGSYGADGQKNKNSIGSVAINQKA